MNLRAGENQGLNLILKTISASTTDPHKFSLCLLQPPLSWMLETDGARLGLRGWGTLLGRFSPRKASLVDMARLPFLSQYQRMQLQNWFGSFLGGWLPL